MQAEQLHLAILQGDCDAAGWVVTRWTICWNDFSLLLETLYHCRGCRARYWLSGNGFFEKVLGKFSKSYYKTWKKKKFKKTMKKEFLFRRLHASVAVLPPRTESGWRHQNQAAACQLTGGGGARARGCWCTATQAHFFDWTNDGGLCSFLKYFYLKKIINLENFDFKYFKNFETSRVL